MSTSAKQPNAEPTEQEQHFLLVWHLEFTLLEKYIVKILEKMHHCSDEQISEILGIGPQDVRFIVNDEGLNQYVQGDHSRRTLMSDFTKKEFAEVTINDKDNIIGLYKREYFRNETLDEYHWTDILHKEVPKKLAKEKAHKYYRINKS